MSDFDFSDINLDFLQSTPPRRPQGNERICTPNIKTELDFGPRQISIKKIKSKKISEWGKKIASTDELLTDLKKLKCENLELRTQLSDVQNSAVALQKLYDTEKNEHELKSRQFKVLREKFEQVDGDLTVKNLQCDQLEGELAIFKQRPVEYNTLAVKYLRVVNKLDVEEYKRNFCDRRMNENLRQYCVKYKLNAPPPPSPKPSKSKELQKEDAASQCDPMIVPVVVQPEMKSQSTQCQTDKRSQGCQHISTMTTRGTTTACFIKYRTVGTCFPETQSVSVVDDILREFAPWHNITPISPLVDQPINNEKCVEVKQQSLKSIGTCTWLCNIRRTIDFIPRNKQQRSQQSSLPICDMATTQSIKQEVTTPSPSPTPNVQTNYNVNSNTHPIATAQHTEAASASEANTVSNPLLSALQSSLPLRELSDSTFDSMWHIFGRMLLGLLQTSNAGIAANPSHITNQEAVNQHQFYSWLRELYEISATASEVNVHQQTEVHSTNNVATSPIHLSNLESSEIVAENSETIDFRHTIATTPLHFYQVSPFESPNIIRPQPLRSSTSEESSRNPEDYLHEDGIQTNICPPEICRIDNNYETNASSLSNKKPSKKPKKNNRDKVRDTIKELFPETKVSKCRRKSLNRLLKCQKQKRKTKKLNEIYMNGLMQNVKEETAVDFLKDIFDSSKKTIYVKSPDKETTNLENNCNVEIVKVENLRNFISEASTNNEDKLTPSGSHNCNDTVGNNIDDSLNFKKPKNVHKNFTSSKPKETISTNNILIRKKELYTSLFGDSETDLEDNADNEEVVNVYFKENCSMSPEHRPMSILSESNEQKDEYNKDNKNKGSDDADLSLSRNILTTEFPTPLLKSIEKPLNREPENFFDKDTQEELETLIDKQLNNLFEHENDGTLSTQDYIPSDFENYLQMSTDENNYITTEKTLENSKVTKEHIKSGLMQNGYNKTSAKELDHIQFNTKESTHPCVGIHPEQTENSKGVNLIEIKHQVENVKPLENISENVTSDKTFIGEDYDITATEQSDANMLQSDDKISIIEIESDPATIFKKESANNNKNVSNIHFEHNEFRSDITKAYKLKHIAEKGKTSLDANENCNFLTKKSKNDECMSSLVSKKIAADFLDERRTSVKETVLNTTLSLPNTHSATNFSSEHNISNSLSISASQVSEVSLNQNCIKTNFAVDSLSTSSDEEISVITISTDNSSTEEERKSLVETPNDDISNSLSNSASQVSEVSLNRNCIKKNFAVDYLSTSSDEEISVITISTDNSSTEQERKSLMETPNDDISNSLSNSASQVFEDSLNRNCIKTNFAEDSLSTSSDEEISVITMSTDNSSREQERKSLVESPNELIIDLDTNNTGEEEEKSELQHQALETSMNFKSFAPDTAKSEQMQTQNTETNFDIRNSKKLDSPVQNVIDDLNTSNEISLLVNSTLYKDILSDCVLPALVDNLLNDDNFMIETPAPSDEKPVKRGRKRKSECQPEEQPSCKTEGFKVCKNNLSLMPIELGKYTKVNKVKNPKYEIGAKALKREEKEYTSLETKKREVEIDKPVMSLGFFREINETGRVVGQDEAQVNKVVSDKKMLSQLSSPNLKLIDTFFNGSNNTFSYCDSPLLCPVNNQSIATTFESDIDERNLEDSYCINFRTKPLNIDTSSHSNTTNFSYSDSPLSPQPQDNAIDTQLNSATFEIPIDLSPQYNLASQTSSLLERLMGHYSFREFRRMQTAYSQTAGSYTQCEQVFATQCENVVKDYCCGTTHLEFEQMALEVKNKLQNCSIKNSLLCKAIIKIAKNAEASTAKEKDLPSIIHEMPPRHLSPCLQRLFYLLQVINTVKPTFCKELLIIIDATLFNLQQSEKLTLSGSVHLIQLYLMACKFLECKFEQHPARMLIAKCLYFHAIKSISMIHEILMWCPTAIPPREDRSYDRSDALITVIQQLLMATKYDMNKEELRGKVLLSKLRFEYHYTPWKPSLDDTIYLLLEKIKMSKFCNLSLAFALICKRMQPKRTEQLLQTLLLPLANEYFSEALKNTAFDERIANLLDIISKVVKPLPLDSDVAAYLNLFSRFLTNFNRDIIQESALHAIIRLQRFGYVNCFQRLIGFHPNFEFSAPTQAMLRTFIHRKPLSFLYKVFRQSRGN